MQEILQTFFSTGNFIPHGHCYLWKPELVWLEIISNALIALAYFSIPIVLVYLVKQRGDLFHWVSFLFSAFILTCGAGHLLEIWTIWHPTYWLSTGVNLLTATISVLTAIVLLQLLPEIIQLPSPTHLATINSQLELEIIERKLSQEKLLQQERTLRTILDNAPIWIWMTNLVGKMQFVNQTFCDNVAIPEAQFLAAAHYSEVLGEKESAGCMASDIACWHQEHPFHTEETLQFADGQYHDLEIIKAKIKDDKGEVIGLLGLALDVTERKRVETALQQSEKQFRQLAQHEELLNRLASQIRNSLDLDTILQTAVSAIRELLQIERCREHVTL